MQAVITADGAFQAAGAALVVLGMVWRVPVLVRDRVGLRATVAPILGAGGAAGIGVVGEF